MTREHPNITESKQIYIGGEGEWSSLEEDEHLPLLEDGGKHLQGCVHAQVGEGGGLILN